MFVTGRADARIIKPGWDAAAFDLQLVVRNYIKDGMCVWDIGSNQGIFSTLAASKVGRNGAVYALEADPHYADMIHRTTKRLPENYERINILCAAISGEVGVLEFAVAAKGHARSRLLSAAPEDFPIAGKKSVASLTGDFLLDHWRSPDFIKMDVEGEELNALAGSASVLRKSRPVFYLEVSRHHEEAVTDLLRSFDYSIFHLAGSGEEEPIETCSFHTIAKPSEKC